MPKETTNYSFKKPLYTENADIAVINENLDEIDKILAPDITETNEPGEETKGRLAIVLGWIANRIKAITGKTRWQDTPSVTLEDCSEHINNGSHANATATASGFMSAADKAKLDNATNLNTASTLMMRDSTGRARVELPLSSNDIANKNYVDSHFVRRDASTTMAAMLTAQSNTAYTTKQVRNIVLWINGDTPPATSYGDIVIKL